MVIATGLGCGNPPETFEYGIPLAGGWLTQTTTGPVYWSTTANENACVSENGLNNSPGSGYAACADADTLNEISDPYDAELWSNSFSLTGTAEASLKFAAAYADRFSLPGTDTFDVDISTNNGSSWTNALHWDETHSGEIVTINLNAYIGVEDIRLRFRNYSIEGDQWYEWVHIDDVEVLCGNPTIELIKTVGTDPNVCSPENVLTVNQATAVHYCYEVTNHSGITLTTHNLIDNELGSLLSGYTLALPPGGSAWLTQTAIITETTVNTATWTAISTGSLIFTATDTVSATVIVDPNLPDPYLINLPMILKQVFP